MEAELERVARQNENERRRLFEQHNRHQEVHKEAIAAEQTLQQRRLQERLNARRRSRAAVMERDELPGRYDALVDDGPVGVAVKATSDRREEGDSTTTTPAREKVFVTRHEAPQIRKWSGADGDEDEFILRHAMGKGALADLGDRAPMVAERKSGYGVPSPGKLLSPLPLGDLSLRGQAHVAEGKDSAPVEPVPPAFGVRPALSPRPGYGGLKPAGGCCFFGGVLLVCG